VFYQNIPFAHFIPGAYMIFEAGEGRKRREQPSGKLEKGRKWNRK
jgi:hypothetical protein